MRNASSAPFERERRFLLWLGFGSKSNCKKASLPKKRRRGLRLHQEPYSYDASLNQSLGEVIPRLVALAMEISDGASAGVSRRLAIEA